MVIMVVIIIVIVIVIAIIIIIIIIYRILQGGKKIWILCLSGKNYMSRVSAAHEWDVVFAART